VQLTYCSSFNCSPTDVFKPSSPRFPLRLQVRNSDILPWRERFFGALETTEAAAENKS
jgi:hypothetical protein